MKKIIGAIVISFLLSLGIFGPAEAVVRVSGYFRSNGVYVQPYYRSSPNSYKWDNWSAKGNYNPYTGAKGYKNIWSW